ncbi:hypothetical protein FOA52_015524 [Chlamydomonas sp. UWO 241]|nr:hypothetical protein FOA52_015524 [Chlamydomonas sp. UWO 241]
MQAYVALMRGIGGASLPSRTGYTSATRCTGSSVREHRASLLVPQCSASGRGSTGGAGSSGSGSSGAGQGGPERNRDAGKRLYKRGKARQPGRFEIQVVAPPPRSLGIFALPPLTHNGEMIEVDGDGYVVTATVFQFKLQKGKYVRDHNRLDVLPTGRWLLNQQLESLLKATYLGPSDADADPTSSEE